MKRDGTVGKYERDGTVGLECSSDYGLLWAKIDSNGNCGYWCTPHANLCNVLNLRPHGPWNE